MQRCMEAAETMRRGGGVGYDFSAIRPKGARVRGTNRAPAARCRTCACSIRAAKPWNRPARGAARKWASCAAIIRTSKSSSTPKTTAICATSTSASASPMSSCGQSRQTAIGNSCTRHRRAPSGRTAVRQRSDGMWVYRTLRARELWQQIMQSTYDHAEPGMFFLDHMNRRRQSVVLREDRVDAIPACRPIRGR